MNYICESWKETKSEFWKIKNDKKQQILVENDLYIANKIGRLSPPRVIEPPLPTFCLCKNVYDNEMGHKCLTRNIKH